MKMRGHSWCGTVGVAQLTGHSRQAQWAGHSGRETVGGARGRETGEQLTLPMSDMVTAIIPIIIDNISLVTSYL